MSYENDVTFIITVLKAAGYHVVINTGENIEVITATKEFNKTENADVKKK